MKLNIQKAVRTALLMAGCCAAVSAGAFESVVKLEIDRYGDLSSRKVITQGQNDLVQSFGYSNHGTPTHIDLNNQSWLDGDVTFDSMGGVSSMSTNTISLHNGITIDGITSTAQLDTQGRLQAQSTRYGQTNAYAIDTIEYDVWGMVAGFNRNDRSYTNAAFSYQYTRQNQLSRFDISGAGTAKNTTVTYGYDRQGNLISRNQQVGNLPMTQLPADTQYDQNNHHLDWQYDEVGNLIEDEKRIYKYNAAGRLALVIDKQTGDWVEHYLYGTDGDRARVMTANKVSYMVRDNQGAMLRKVDYRSDDAIHKQDYINSVKTVTLMDEQITSGGSTSFKTQLKVKDRMASPVANYEVTASSSVSNEHEYAPFGEQIAAAKHSGPYGFTGHEDDGNTGLTYMKERFYASDFGRFNRPDPARDFNGYFPATHNLYQYAHNNPVNAWDPNGQLANFIVGGLLGGVVGGVVGGLVHVITSGENMTSASFGAAVLGGATTGALIGAAGPAGAAIATKSGIAVSAGTATAATLGANAAAGAAGNLVEQGTKNVMEGKSFGDNIDRTDVAISAASGVVGGQVGSMVSKKLGTAFAKDTVAGQADKVTKMALKRFGKGQKWLKKMLSKSKDGKAPAKFSRLREKVQAQHEASTVKQMTDNLPEDLVVPANAITGTLSIPIEAVVTEIKNLVNKIEEQP